MAGSADSDYKCSLDEKSIKKAKDELNENPQDRLAAVQAFREWIQEQPHITCPNPSTEVLLRFLRGTKFSQLKAREKFEESLTLKTKAPEWFKDIDSHDPKIKTIIEAGYAVRLPGRTKEGCAVVIYQLNTLHKLIGEMKMKMGDLVRFGIVFFEKLIQEEMTQVNGIVFIVDFTGMTAGLLTKMMSSENSKFHKIAQKSMVGRFKNFHYYNAGLFVETLVAFYRPFMPKKWIDRIVCHDTMESIYEKVPKEILPIEYLPDDYKGPNAGHISELCQDVLRDLQDNDYRESLLYKTSMAFSVDESKRPTETVTQHFRKLNVD